MLLHNLGNVLLAQGKVAEGLKKHKEADALERAQSLKQAENGDAQALNDLAWSMATSPNGMERDGPKAVELAEKSVAASERKNPMTLDTLAAAYAEAGRFTNAVAVQQEAIALLKNDDEKRDYSSRLKLYALNVPYREYPYVKVQGYAQMLRQHNKLKEAEAMLREVLDI